MITPEGAARLEDLRFMADARESLDGAAQRLGMKPKSLERFLRRWDSALATDLVARNPRDVNATGRVLT